MQSPLFSIIIPAFQRPKQLARAIESIELQDFQDWELIVVDDGSQPPLAFKQYLNNERIHFFRQENAGPAAARKQGLSKAHGRYFCLLDDDDYFLPNHLSTLADQLELEGYPKRVFRTPLEGIDQDNQRINYPNYNNGQDALQQYWEAPCGLTSLCFPIEVIHNCPIDPRPRIIEDFEWVSRVLTKYELQQIPGPATVAYVQHQHNRSLTEAGIKSVEERINIVNTAYDQPGVAERIPQRLKNRLLQHQLCHAARQCAQIGDKKRGWKYLWRATKLGPLNGALDSGRAFYRLVR